MKSIASALGRILCLLIALAGCFVGFDTGLAVNGLISLLVGAIAATAITISGKLDRIAREAERTSILAEDQRRLLRSIDERTRARDVA